ncbi:MAG: type II CAAX prenyl endopeptidase Rce1 family protein [Bacteroidales bacterium]
MIEIMYIIPQAIFLGIPLLTQKTNLKKKLGLKETMNWKKELKTSLKYLALIFIVSLSLSTLFVIMGWDTGNSQLFNLNLLILFPLILLGSFAEEVFFRGFIQRKTNLATTVFLFSVFHSGRGIHGLIAGGLIGLVLGLEYRESGGITASFITHLLYNLIVVSIVIFV